jgi:hypothetical protein
MQNTTGNIRCNKNLDTDADRRSEAPAHSKLGNYFRAPNDAIPQEGIWLELSTMRHQILDVERIAHAQNKEGQEDNWPKISQRRPVLLRENSKCISKCIKFNREKADESAIRASNFYCSSQTKLHVL